MTARISVRRLMYELRTPPETAQDTARVPLDIARDPMDIFTTPQDPRRFAR